MSETIDASMGLRWFFADLAEVKLTQATSGGAMRAGAPDAARRYLIGR